MPELPNLVVRAAERTDATAIADVHVAAWRGAYRGIFPDELLDGEHFAERRRATWADWKFGAGDRVSLATLAKTADTPPIVVAFSWFGPERDRGRGFTGRGEVHAFYADPRVWGTGVATALMEHSELRLRTEGFTAAVLWVLTDNPRARRFYERHGWAPTGIEGEFSLAGTTAAEIEYRKELT